MLTRTIRMTVLLFFVIANLMALTTGLKKVGYKRNIKIAAEWKCKNPQPRLIHIGHLKEYAAPNILYQPQAVLLHRCGEWTGCCQKLGEECSSTENKEELVNFAIHAHDTVKNKEKKLWIQLVNHTHCECISPNNAKSRAKRFLVDSITD